ncbi:acyl-CoA dehydrogenase family protein [Chloroflexota bacterium]
MEFEFTPEQKKLQEKAREFGERWRPFAAEWDEKDHISNMKEIIDDARECGFLGMTVPKKYGGQDLTVLDWTITVEEIARAAQSWVPGDCVFMTSGPGPSVCMRSPNEEVKRKYLPSIVNGEKLCMVTMTEPKYGSAMTDMETSATADGDYYIINGSKRLITGAGEIELYSTFVRFGGIPGAAGIGAIMLERGMPGFVFGKNPKLIGLRGVPHGELYFENCRMPKENLLFPEGHFRELMEAFNMERMHNLILSVALAEASYDEAVKYVQARQQFGRDIIEFQGIQWAIADMWVRIQAARWLMYMAAATAVDGKYPKALEVSTAKLFANDIGTWVSQRASYLQGSDGFSNDFPAERLTRDLLIMPVAGGTPEILRNVIAAQLFPQRKFSQRKGQ